MRIKRSAVGDTYVPSIEDVICEIRSAHNDATSNGLRISRINAFIQPEIEFGIPREQRPARYYVSISLEEQEDQPPVPVKSEQPPKKKGWWA